MATKKTLQHLMKHTVYRGQLTGLLRNPLSQIIKVKTFLMASETEFKTNLFVQTKQPRI